MENKPESKPGVLVARVFCAIMAIVFAAVAIDESRHGQENGHLIIASLVLTLFFLFYGSCAKEKPAEPAETAAPAEMEDHVDEELTVDSPAWKLGKKAREHVGWMKHGQ